MSTIRKGLPLMRLGADLGFDEKFCEDAIRSIMTNQHIVDEPPRFSDPHVARCFIRDGIRLSLIDGEAHETELAWLKTVASVNALGGTFFTDAVRTVLHAVRTGAEDTLDAMCFEWI
jgi:hypothetical protein